MLNISTNIPHCSSLGDEIASPEAQSLKKDMWESKEILSQAQNDEKHFLKNTLLRHCGPRPAISKVCNPHIFGRSLFFLCISALERQRKKSEQIKEEKLHAKEIAGQARNDGYIFIAKY